jgi:chemotaxis response regulator CheB
MLWDMDSQSAMSAPAGLERENKIIVIGCSRGGLSALTEVLQGLPVDLPAQLLSSFSTYPRIMRAGWRRF